MSKIISSQRAMALTGLIISVSLGSIQASTLWNEGVSGDLSDNQAAPHPFTLSSGINSVIGTVGGGNTQDWIALTVPSGFNLTSVILSTYASTDIQGFTGLQSGSTFVGNTFVASSYLGYAHFGTNASNGPELPANMVGVNILPNMGHNGPSQTGAGAQGFTAPLGAGTYTFLIQQLGAITSYQFDYTITAVPEPASLALVPLIGGWMLLKRRNTRK